MDKSQQEPVDRAAYGAFISQIELRNIWLRSAKVENNHGSTQPDELIIAVDGNHCWEPISDGFRAFQSYRIRLDGQDETRYAEIEVTFVVDYDSIEPMTDALFETFAVVNLPLNTWPYFREYAATSVGRMGWLPITLPAFKVGTPTDSSLSDSAQDATKSKTPRTRKKRDVTLEESRS
jgi:hypothetical protein